MHVGGGAVALGLDSVGDEANSDVGGYGDHGHRHERVSRCANPQ